MDIRPRFFYRPEIYQPILIFIVTGSFDLIAHYLFDAFPARTSQLAAFASDVFASIACALLVVVWQRNLRRHIRMLELHLRTRKVMQQKIHNSLAILTSLAEKHRGENLSLDRDIQSSLEQLKLIEKKVAFDPSILIETLDFDTMIA